MKRTLVYVAPRQKRAITCHAVAPEFGGVIGHQEAKRLERRKRFASQNTQKKKAHLVSLATNLKLYS